LPLSLPTPSLAQSILPPLLRRRWHEARHTIHSSIIWLPSGDPWNTRLPDDVEEQMGLGGIVGGECGQCDRMKWRARVGGGVGGRGGARVCFPYLIPTSQHIQSIVRYYTATTSCKHCRTTNIINCSWLFTIIILSQIAVFNDYLRKSTKSFITMIGIRCVCMCVRV